MNRGGAGGDQRQGGGEVAWTEDRRKKEARDKGHRQAAAGCWAVFEAD